MARRRVACFLDPDIRSTVFMTRLNPNIYETLRGQEPRRLWQVFASQRAWLEVYDTLLLSDLRVTMSVIRFLNPEVPGRTSVTRLLNLNVRETTSVTFFCIPTYVSLSVIGFLNRDVRFTASLTRFWIPTYVAQLLWHVFWIPTHVGRRCHHVSNTPP